MPYKSIELASPVRAYYFFLIGISEVFNRKMWVFSVERNHVVHHNLDEIRGARGRNAHKLMDQFIRQEYSISQKKRFQIGANGFGIDGYRGLAA